MKELLNKLIEKGWKPRWKIDMEFMYMLWDKEHPIYTLFFKWWVSWVISAIEQHNIRELVSKESWLWQFVCENGMIDDSNFYTREKVDEDRDWIDITYSTIAEGEKWGHYEYRLIESALCDEDKLEKFLLNNIKIDEKYNI